MLGKRKSSLKSLHSKRDQSINKNGTKKCLSIWEEIGKEEAQDSRDRNIKDKISLSNRGITLIDKLSPQTLAFHKKYRLLENIKTLYLSNNFISNLENIEQFQTC